MRRHGWQRPLHPLQIVGMAVYSFFVVAFYTFLGLFLGSRNAEITVTTLFSLVAVSVMLLFVRCTAIDPSDKTRFRKKRKPKPNGYAKLNYGFMLGQIVMRFFRRVEKKILRTFIRRKYLDPWTTSSAQDEPLLPFPLLTKDDNAIAPESMEEDVSFCSLCDFEVKKHSKHCRTCNRCVEGFDHHCRWLNNCVGKKNYTSFILLMICVLSLLVFEGGTAVAIFVRCFTNKKGLEEELERKLYINFPREALATISVLLILMTGYSTAAMGQLFFFHVVLIRKGMRTYDYIMAMKEENESMEMDLFDDSDFSSDYNTDDDSPVKSTFVPPFICSSQGVNQTQNPQRLSIRIDGDTKPSAAKNQGFRASIDPWKLINMSREKALIAAEKAKEKLIKQQPTAENGSLRPLPLEKKSVLVIPDRSMVNTTPILLPKRSPGMSPQQRFSSPRRRLSAPSPQPKYRSDFDLKLTNVSMELETYISTQVLCSVLNNNGSEASPRL